MGDADLNEIALNLRDKIEQNESIASFSTFKDIPIDFGYCNKSAHKYLVKTLVVNNFDALIKRAVIGFIC